MESNFHLSLPCRDIENTKVFYSKILETPIGRNTNTWIDVDLFGNQITFTKSGDFNFDFKNYRLGDQILPSFHFGIIITIDDFGKLYSRLLQLDIGATLQTTYMKESVGEHLSFFVKDPNGYMIEFKCFKNHSEVFKTQK
ncbi:VOC family protein [Polaribacter sp. HL-MS24]|uniref:VOC family protein n=1 Tax=Polaribacter sp. HL-MS24 TaxID=3077735 RepID=UPI002934B04D|nr:VOC family protein [Polaribacter sp. HL-MS24]WOC40329.1 VOC family protein [Polaribacter sp. HL-MS24]